MQNNNVREMNILSILRRMQKNQQMTKSELASQTGLTIVTVGNVINILLKNGIVKEVGCADSTGGRKALFYRLSERRFRIVGLYFRVNGLTCMLFDLGLNVIARKELSQPMENVTVEASVKAMCDMMKEILEESSTLYDDIASVSAIVPGTVDFERGIVHCPPGMPKWRDVPLRAMIEERLGINAYVDNDSNAQALVCKWKDQMDLESNMAYIGLLGGVGSGILIKGKVYRGNCGLSGEIGHITVDPNGPICRCGNKGCMELYTGDIAVFEKISNAVEQAGKGILYEACGHDKQRITWKLIVEAARRGDETVLAEFRKASQYIVMGVGTLLKLVAPEELVLNSVWFRELPDIYYGIIDRIFETCGFLHRNDLRITINKRDNILDLAAGAVALDHILMNTEDNRLLDQIVQE